MDNEQQVLEKIKLINNSIKAENEMINQRLTWLGIFEGLLFASVPFFLLNKLLDFLYIICSVGMFCSFSILYSTIRSSLAIRDTLLVYNDLSERLKIQNYNLEEEYPRPIVTGKIGYDKVRPDKNHKIGKLGNILDGILWPTQFFPITIIVAWILLLIYSFNIVSVPM